MARDANARTAAGAATADAPAKRAAAAAAPAIRVHNIAVGGGPNSVAIDSRSRAVWVAAGHLVRISEARQRVTARIPILLAVNNVAVDVKRHAVWATSCVGTCLLAEVSEATNHVVHQVSGFGPVSGLAVDSRTGVIWMATVNSAKQNVVLAVSETTRQIVRRIRMRFGADHVLGGMAADPRTGTVWVSVVPCPTCSARDSVAEIKESAHRVTHVYPTADQGISTSVIAAVDSRRGTVWLASGMIREPSGHLEVISIARHKIIRRIATFWVAPEGLAIDSRRAVVVATGGGTPGHRDSVVLVSESSGKQTAKIPMGLYPNMLALDPATGNVYVPIVFKAEVSRFRL